jgi:hypothetical protein
MYSVSYIRFLSRGKLPYFVREFSQSKTCFLPALRKKDKLPNKGKSSPDNNDAGRLKACKL